MPTFNRALGALGGITAPLVSLMPTSRVGRFPAGKAYFARGQRHAKEPGTLRDLGCWP
jgi:hypothetical protein